MFVAGIIDDQHREPTPHFVPPPPLIAIRLRGSTGPNGACALNCAALSCTNNGFFSWAGWFNNPDWTPDGTTSAFFPYFFMADPTGAYQLDFHRNGTTQWTCEFGNAAGNREIGCYTNTSRLTDGAWIHIMASADVNHAAGSKKLKIYVNDTDATDSTDTDSQAAWTFDYNGKGFSFGDDGFRDTVFCDVADFSLWPGVTFLTAGDIAQSTRRLFIDASGHKVAPSVSIAALGTPALMLTGGLSGFLANTLGSSGPLTVPSGWDSPHSVAGPP